MSIWKLNDISNNLAFHYFDEAGLKMSDADGNDKQRQKEMFQWCFMEMAAKALCDECKERQQNLKAVESNRTSVTS